MPLRRLHHLARADFYERVRRHGFLVAVLFSVLSAYGFLPPNHSNYVTLSIENHRGVYNSAWIGTAVAMLTSAFLSLIGFYIVKNAVERDRRTGVGEILATTPISKFQYTLGKTLSNFTVLATMTAIVAVSCVVMQILRGEAAEFDAWQMFAPFVLITLPPLMITSALAVLFEMLPGLRGGAGNVLWVFVWGWMLGGNFDTDMTRVHNDPLATGIAVPDMVRACQAAFPGFDAAHAGVSMGVNIRDEAVTLKTFAWDGIDWSAKFFAWRLQWLLAGLAIGATAAIPFDRFDPARRALRTGKRRRAARTLAGEQSAAGLGAPTSSAPHREDAEERVVRGASHALTPLAERSHHSRFLAMVRAEWKLIVRGLRWWWIGPLGFGIAALTAPMPAVKSILLPLAWFWPVLRWSRLGTREATHNTEQIFFSAPRPLSRQLLASWAAGVMLAVVAASPFALRFLIAGDAHALLAWCSGALFAPALAVALGVWTRAGKTFEAIYTCLCYAVIQSAAPLDFMGAVAAAPSSNPVVFAMLAVVLLAAALAGRRRRLQN
jgi:hypothetical protein